MMETIINAVVEYRVYIGIGLFVLLAILTLTSSTLRGQLKKGIILLLIILGLGGGYYFITGNSPSDILADINRFFNSSPTNQEPSHKYYKQPKERYGDQIEKL